MHLEISLNFMPAFYRRHLGLAYGEAYYFDPAYRADVERAEGRFLYETLGRYGVGSPDPAPSPSLFIQPVDLVMRTQGAEWRFPPDGTVESWGQPWAGLSPEEIAAIQPRDAAHHPVIDAILAQYQVLTRLYGESADIFGTKSGTMLIHTPYTTAHQLCGQDLFVMMLTDPEAAGRVFDKVWQIYEAIFGRIAQATGARLTRVHLGDCSASLVSAPVYREVVLPANLAVASRFEGTGYHSCGRSSHLLEAFGALPRLAAIELGAGTDLAESARLLPGVALKPLIDPVLMREGSPDDVRREVEGIRRDTAPAPAVTLCAWSFDPETPLENVEALYEVVNGSTGQ